MRVLHVTPAIASRYGGPSKVVLDTCEALRGEGIDAEIATTNADGANNLAIPKERPAIVHGIPIYFFERQLPWRYKFSWGLTMWLKRNIANYDLLHVHALFSYSTAVAAFYARKYSVPYIMLPHGMLSPWPVRRNWFLKAAYLKIVENKNLQGAAGVHFTAEEEFLMSLAAGRSNFVLPYVLDLANQTNGFRTSEESSKLRILYLSRIDPKKGIEILIKALRQLVDDGRQFELVLAGSGDPAYEQKVNAMVRSYGLSSAVTFTGFVEGSQKAELFHGADIFVLPSYDENFGIAVTEAMAAGLPVIISDRVNIHHEVSKAHAGIVVSPTVDALGAAINTLADDPGLRTEMGKRGFQLVSDRFSVAATTKETLKIYRDVIRNSRESPCWRTVVN